jgi:hypothetical protein
LSSSLLENRVRIAAYIANQSSPFEDGPKIVRETLGDGWIGSPALNNSYEGFKLVGGVVYQLANSLSGQRHRVRILRTKYPNVSLKIEENEWAKLLKDLIRGGGELFSYPNEDGHTLLFCVWGKINRYPLYGFTSPHDEMRMWLQVLYEAGINLPEYGRNEAELLQSHRTSRSFPRFHHRRHGKELSCRLIKFEYGSLPSDWYFWMSEPSDKFAGDFWSMIENPPRNMPGAWVEESSEEDSSESDY